MPVQLKYLLFAFCLFTLSFSLKADHYLGASISYKSLGAFAYEFTVITYTATDHPQSDKASLSLFCGDGNKTVLARSNGNGTLVNADILKSIYKGQYSYNKQGNYKAYVSEPYRHGSIENIDGGQSSSKKLYVSALVPVYTDAGVCANNSAEYQLTPIFYAYEGVEYSTHFGLYDADGDSLVFDLSTCKGVNGVTLPNYTLPASVAVNAQTGILSWDSPTEGIFALSMLVNEFRKGKKIGESAIDYLVFVSKEFSVTPSFSLDPQFNIVDGTEEVTINPGDVLKFGSAIALPGVHSITYSAWNNTGVSVPHNTVIGTSLVADTSEWTTQLSQGRHAPYIFVQRFQIIESGKYLIKDFAVLVRVEGNQVVTCTVPDIGTVEKVPPDLFEFQISPTVCTDGVYLNAGYPSSLIDVTMYDMQGREIALFSNFTQETVFIDVSNLSSAVYILALRTSDRLIKRMIVKQ